MSDDEKVWLEKHRAEIEDYARKRDITFDDAKKIIVAIEKAKK